MKNLRNNPAEQIVPAEKKEGSQPRSISSDFSIAAALSFLVFIVYSLTLCRTIYTGDDGDFIVCMATWGNSHPTGYPLFLMLGHLFLSLLSPVIAEPAARINLMTALFGAASTGFFYRFLSTGLKVERLWAVAGALLLAFSPTLWQQSLSCEVYSLTCLFLSALLYLMSVWREQPQNTRLLRGITLLYGLACTNHLTIVLFLPGFLAFVLYHRPALLRAEKTILLSLVGLFLIPLSLYAYLPLAALFGHSPINWGDPSTPSLFWAKITGQQYRPAMFHSLHGTSVGAWRYATLLWNEFRPWTLWLAPLGIASLRRRDAALCFLLLYVWIANISYAINYSISDIYVYYIPSYVITTAFVAEGASATLRWLWKRLNLSTERQEHYLPLIAIVILALSFLHLSLHYGETDKSGNYLESDFAANILKSAPPNAIIITGNMTIESLWYRRFVLGERGDVVLINRDMLYGSNLPYMAWYRDHILQMYPDLYRSTGGLPPASQKLIQGDFLLGVLQDALEREIPVLWVPNDATENQANGFMKNSYAALTDQNFDKVLWGVGQRFYLKKQAPSVPEAFTANASLWSTFQFHDIAAWAHQDSQQEAIPLRYLNALMGWGQICELSGRWDLAESAYKQAQQLYNLPVVQESLNRCAHKNRSLK